MWRYTMTTINKEVTREEERTKTVKTCDVCGLSEVELSGNKNIDRITGGLSVEHTYGLVIHELDSVDGDPVERSEETFDNIDKAEARLKEIDMDTHSVSKSMVANVSWELDIDACERCQQMMFGAMRDNFSMKSV